MLKFSKKDFILYPIGILLGVLFAYPYFTYKVRVHDKPSDFISVSYSYEKSSPWFIYLYDKYQGNIQPPKNQEDER